MRTLERTATTVAEKLSATMGSKGMMKSLMVVWSKVVVTIGWTLTCQIADKVQLEEHETESG